MTLLSSNIIASKIKYYLLFGISIINLCSQIKPFLFQSTGAVDPLLFSTPSGTQTNYKQDTGIFIGGWYTLAFEMTKVQK